MAFCSWHGPRKKGCEWSAGGFTLSLGGGRGLLLGEGLSPSGCGSARPCRGLAEMGTFLGDLVASRVNTEEEGWAARRQKESLVHLIFAWLLLSAGGHCPVHTGTHTHQEENAD